MFLHDGYPSGLLFAGATIFTDGPACGQVTGTARIRHAFARAKSRLPDGHAGVLAAMERG